MTSTIAKLLVNSENPKVLVQEAENFELQAGGISPDLAGQFYGALLLGYLAVGDLPSAKFTYKRIPADLVATNKTIQTIWEVATHLWKRQVPLAHKTLSGWQVPDIYLKLVQTLRANLQQRSLTLLMTAYSDLGVDDVAKELGVTEAEAVKIAAANGWVAQGKRFSRYVAPPSNKKYSTETLAFLATNTAFLETS
eukprot:PhF_6_TR19469/c0_g1_i1/m.28453/K12181/COPS8, CSN8; COP9 signalosome complex subunit 8